MARTVSEVEADDGPDTAAAEVPGVVDDSAQQAGADGAEAPGRRPAVPAALLACLVVTIVAAIVGGIAGVRVHAAQRDADRDAAVIAATRKVVADLVSLRHDTAAADVQRIAEGTTGTFRDQFTGTGATFTTVLEQGKVESTGHAEEVALLDVDDTKATTLAAVVSTVKNTEAPEGQPRVYRMKVTLESSSGTWLVSNVEFVS
ncbi:hypothetical protein [Nocardia higoensis]|uniref:hypothetical protein n=1 Tax=Nocardia higoensis TaxID=228599 RepID=UPI000593CBAF|nr:hypothetical protein [Nocardia higoensis]